MYPWVAGWDKQGATAIAKSWVCVTGDMEVEVVEVKP
jgi:hypothetical protein